MINKKDKDMESKNIYRITDYAILRISSTTKTDKFAQYKFDDVIQYVHEDTNQTEQEKIINSTVWFAGQYKARLNKVYDSNPLLTLDNKTSETETNVQQVDVMLRQGYSFLNVFGLHIVILDINNNIVYVSRILTEQDFKINSNKELIDGSFWLQTTTIYIPNVVKTLSVQITQVTYDDIESDGDNIGTLYNFPYAFEPLVSEKPIPDYICTSITLDDNFFLEVKLYTTENKTVEQAILDYMDLEIADIQVSHVINYGNEIDGYKTIRISNEDDKYLPVKFALDLSPWSKDGSYTETSITITVTTEILINNTLMSRNSELVTDINAVINPLIAENIVHPETNFPVEVKNENLIVQKVIQQNKETKVITIYQPLFAELISDDLIIENKNIVFEKITSPSYLVIEATNRTEEQIVESKKTIDETIYFDISELITPESNTTYKILDKSNLSIIGKGNVLVENSK